MLFNEDTIRNNVYKIVYSQNNDILAVGKNGNINKISKYNLLGRLINWIKDPQGLKVKSCIQKTIAAMDRIYSESMQTTWREVGTFRAWSTAGSLNDPKKYIFLNELPHGLEKFESTKKIKDELRNKAVGFEEVTDFRIPYPAMALFLAQKLDDPDITLQALIFRDKVLTKEKHDYSLLDVEIDQAMQAKLNSLKK